MIDERSTKTADMFPPRFIEWGIYLIAFLIPFQIIIPEFPHLITICVILSALLFIASFANAIVSGRVTRPSVNILIGLLLVTSLLSVINSDNISLSWDSLLYPLVWILTFYFNIVWNIHTRQQLKKLLYAFLGGGVAICIFALINVSTQRGLAHSLDSMGLLPYFALEPLTTLGYPADIALGTFFNPDYFAAFLLFPSCLAFALALWGPGRWGIAGKLLFPLTAFTLLLTRGRGAAIALLFALILISLIYLVRHRRKVIPMALLVVFIVSLALLLSPYAGNFWTGIGGFLGGEKWTLESINRSFELRSSMISTRMEHFYQHPLLGYGYQYSEWAVLYYHPRGGITYFAPGHSHNWYMEILVSSGIAGLLPILMITAFALWRSFKACLKSNDRLIQGVSIGIMGALAAFLVDGLFNHSYREQKVAITFWVAIALAMVLHKLTHPDSAAEASRMPPGGGGLSTLAIIGGTIVLGLAMGYTTVYIGDPTIIYSIFATLAMIGIGVITLARAVT